MFFLHAYFVAWSQTLAMRPEVETNTFSRIPKLKQMKDSHDNRPRTWVWLFISLQPQNQQQGCDAGIPETAKNPSIDPSFCKKGQHVDVAFHYGGMAAWFCWKVCEELDSVLYPASTFARWKEKDLAWKLQAFCVFCASARNSPTIYLNQSKCDTRHLSGIFRWHIRTHL